MHRRKGRDVLADSTPSMFPGDHGSAWTHQRATSFLSTSPQLNAPPSLLSFEPAWHDYDCRELSFCFWTTNSDWRSRCDEDGRQALLSDRAAPAARHVKWQRTVTMVTVMQPRRRGRAGIRITGGGNRKNREERRIVRGPIWKIGLKVGLISSL